MPGTLFISDLHLDPERPGITELFIEFLAKQAPAADALYILGDLFEAWIGDDDDGPMNLAVREALQRCSRNGIPVFIMHGNRDFLLGEEFAGQCGCTILDDTVRLDLYGTPTLLMHGDLLCTDDTKYMAFRNMVRDPGWQQDFLSKPLHERRQMAVEMRATSRAETRGKPESIMDVNQEAVLRVMSENRVVRLIHGHTHRPAFHDLTVSGHPAQRIVLGDWYHQGSVLRCSATDCRLEATM